MVVVDASVAYKWFAKREPNFETALKILEDHKSGSNTAIAPQLLIFELANAWATKTTTPLRRAKRNLRILEEAQIQFTDITFDIIEKAITLSKKQGVSVYDATYAVLAKEKGCNLITADDKFADQVKLRFVKKLGEIVQSF